jgi:hypothetical protein
MPRETVGDLSTQTSFGNIGEHFICQMGSSDLVEGPK